MSPSPPAKHFIEITDPHGGDFEQMFQIYEEALPAGERKPRGMVEKLVRRPDYHVVALKERGLEKVLSFMMLFVSAHEEVALLEYMASAPSRRNQGLGAVMFEKAVEMAGSRPLLVEFDSEREDSPDYALRIRRKNFYLRLGCQQIANLDYRMPRVSHASPPVMDLAYHWKGCEKPPGTALVRRWLQTLYAEVYERPRDDPAIDVMMAALENHEARPAPTLHP